MSLINTINTILIVGATSGLGEQFARRLHALGKKVIITGRRVHRLSAIKSNLGSEVETYQWDITDLTTTTSKASEILKSHPETNSVFIMAGMGRLFSFLDPSTSTDEKIITECNTNVTAQMLLTRVFIPHLSSLASKGQPTSFLLMGSGMGFVPNGYFPVYVAAKAATHALAVALRQSVNTSKDDNIKGSFSVVEVVTSYVATDFDKEFRTLLAGGVKPLPVEEFMESAMSQFGAVEEDGKPPKEIVVGTAQPRVALWRESVGKYLKEIGIDG